MKKLSVISISIVVALVVGLAIGWTIGNRNKESELRGITLMHEMYQVGMSANTLNLMRDEKHEKAVTLNDSYLEWSLDSIETLLKEGAQVHDIAFPNLRDSLRRANQYYKAIENEEHAKRVDNILHSIDKVHNIGAS